MFSLVIALLIILLIMEKNISVDLKQFTCVNNYAYIHENIKLYSLIARNCLHL